MKRFAFLLLALMLIGCDLKRPAVVVRTYLPPPLTVRAARTLDMHIERFDVAPAFEGKPLVWRLSETRYESDFYNELLSPPRAVLMNRTREWFRLREQANPGVSPLYIEVSAFYGDLRSMEAAVRVHFRLDGELPFEQEYEERQALSTAEPDALVQALGKAYDRVLARAYADLAQRLNDPSTTPARASMELRK